MMNTPSSKVTIEDTEFTKRTDGNIKKNEGIHNLVIKFYFPVLFTLVI